MLTLFFVWMGFFSAEAVYQTAGQFRCLSLGQEQDVSLLTNVFSVH